LSGLRRLRSHRSQHRGLWADRGRPRQSAFSAHLQSRRDATPVEADIDSDTAARLRQDGIALASSSAIDFRPARSGIEVELRNGKRMQFDVLYPVLGCEVHSGLATALGARCNDVGCLEVDARQQTSVPGIYAAGDVVSDLHQLSVAAGHAGIAATAIHNSLPQNFR
jgi:thioredoxin reductase (NADPH)